MIQFTFLFPVKINDGFHLEGHTGERDKLVKERDKLMKE